MRHTRACDASKRAYLVGLLLLAGAAPAVVRAADSPEGSPAGESSAPKADVSAVASPSAPKTAAPEREAEGDKVWTRGYVSLRYNFRSSTNTMLNRYETDQDLMQDLFVEGGYGSHFRYELSGRVHEDIDGRTTAPRFSGLHDGYDGWGTAWLYTAYAEGLELGPIARARFGRQYQENVEARFDGGLVESSPIADAVKVSVYGGVPVHLYQAAVLGDWLAGVGVEVVAVPRTNLRFDYTHVTDFLPDLARKHAWEGGGEGSKLREANRWGVTLTVRPLDPVRFSARAWTFDGRSTRAEGEAQYHEADLGFTARVKYSAQLGAYRDLTISTTPYDEQLGENHAYHELLVDLKEAVGEHLVVSGGGSIRKLFDQREEGEFNHEFWRVFGQVDVYSLPIDGLTVTFLAEYYRSLTFGRSFQGSGEISQELAKIVTLGAGTRYSAFKLDEFFLKERENARGYYAFAQLRPTQFLRFRLGYSYETDDEDRYHVVRLDARFDF